MQILGHSFLVWGTLDRLKRKLWTWIEEMHNMDFKPQDYSNITDPSIREALEFSNTREAFIKSKYSKEFTDMEIFIVLCSTILLEGVINQYFSLKLDEKAFEKFQWKKLEKKWLECPNEIDSKYSVTEELAKNLKKLIQLRNEMVHNKPLVVIDDLVKFEGSGIKDFTIEELASFCLLPIQLTENLMKSESFPHELSSSLHFMMYTKPNWENRV